MKNTLVRAFVFTLVLSGIAASTVSYRATSQGSSNVMMAKGGNTSLPTPVCAPHDPNHCGMD
jgi:hypothetical protein